MQEALDGRRYAEEYVQTLTHELKSPLSAIRGAVELLQEDPPAAQRQRFLANLDGEARRIEVVVERMLELARLENTREKPEFARLDALALINTVIESHRAQASIRGLAIDPRAPADLRFDGNAFLLHQALSNLLLNAIDFSAEGGRIELAAQREGTRLVFSVADQGPGVPTYAQSRIFDRFYSLARPGSGRKSTGLGLSFVREVARQHDGEITLHNRTEGGAVARLSLPA